MVIAVDLDGTLLDIRYKYYALYSHIVKEHRSAPLNIDAYWTMKRNRVPMGKILSEGNCSLSEKDFTERFAELIENPDYLSLDRLTPRADEFLELMTDPAEPVLVTLRKNKETLSEQLRNLRLSNYFKKIICDTTRGIEHGWRRKEHLLKKTLNRDHGIMIGDSEADIQAGKSVRFKTMALTSGIRTEKILVQYDPDHIFPDMSSLLSHFAAQGVIKR